MALVLTLLLLGLMSVLGLSMVLYFSSDMMINGYYRNYRGSYYAADSGLNIARQALVNRVMADLPATVSVNVSPMPAGEAATVQSAILTGYGASYTSLNSGQAAASWGGSYELTNAAFTCATGCAPTVVTARDSSGNAIGFQYVFNYSLSATGKASGFEQTVVSENGSVMFNAVLTPAAGATVSFAAYGMFIDQQPICGGGYLVPGTITGPVFTNGAWTFGTTGSYIFTDQVGQAAANTGFQFSSTCDQLAASTDKIGSQTIKPTFQSSFKQGQAAVPLPTDSFSQERAMLDGMGTNLTAPTNTDLHSAVKNVSGTAYPSGGAATGVFLPYAPVSGTNTVTGGGIYIEGDSNVVMSTGTSGLGNPTQIFTITQGAIITVVTTDATANTTTFKVGGTTLTLAGVPMNNNNSPATPATMVYANGNINSLTGPGQGIPAIQNGSAITVTAKNDVTITGDILYKSEPVTFTTNQIPGTPPDTLIPGNDHNQTLGVYTAIGNINLNNGQSNGNLEIDASLASISVGGSGGLQNIGAAINTLNIVGGRIQNQIKNINTTTRNVFFDRRYTHRPGFAPPWFPSTILAPPGFDTTNTTASVQRISWNTTPQ